MSQKSSVPQAISFVSQVLKGDSQTILLERERIKCEPRHLPRHFGRLLCSPMRAGDASSPRCGVCLVPYLKPVGFATALYDGRVGGPRAGR